MDHNATNLTVAGQLQAAPHGVTLGHGHGHEHAVVSHEGHNHLERRAASFVLWSTIAALVLAQLGLVRFKKAYPRAYQAVSLLGLWAVPACFAVTGRWWTFLAVWVAFTAATAFFLQLARTTPLAKETPRRVYLWLDLTYRACLAGASASWAAFVACLLFPGLAFLLPVALVDLVLQGLVFSIYFGVLTRDIGEFAAETMKANLGARSSKREEEEGDARATARRLARQQYECALCGGELRIVGEGSAVEAALEGGEDGLLDEGDRLAQITEPVVMRARDGSLVLVYPGTPVALQLEAAARARLAAATAAAAAARAAAGDAGGAPDEQQKVMEFKDARKEGRLYQLQCKHVFHENCIKGWCVVGKKDTCPSCSERVDIKLLLKTSPLWGAPSRAWGQLLDIVRYVVVWNPIVFAVLRLFFWEMGVGVSTTASSKNGGATAALAAVDAAAAAASTGPGALVLPLPSGAGAAQ